MNLSIGLSLTRPSGPLGFNPASLFASGEVGAWYDPSDLTTLYQDAAGTTPVTATGQPVGLMLDKSKGGLQAEQVTNGGFDSATGWTLTGSAAITGGELVFVSGGSGSASYPVSFSAGQQVRVAIDKTVLGASGAGNVVIRFALAGLNIIGVAIGGANGPRSYEQILTLPNNVDAVEVLYNGSGAYEYKFDNVSVKELPGNHATQTTSAARPVLQQSGGLYYLDFDGVDDNLSTAAIDFTASDEMTTAAAVERQNATAGVIAELSSNWNLNTGSFLFWTGTTTIGLGDGFGTASRGTAAVNANQFAYTSAVYPPPARAVLVASHDISDDYTKIRFDGTDSVVATGDKGSGSFSNTSVFIGSRNGTATFAFDGLFFGIVLVSRLLTTAETDDLETYLAAKSGVTL